MRLIKNLILLGTLSILSGCASLSYPLPKCDGYSKRPLNRSMWNQDEQKASLTAPSRSSGSNSGIAQSWYAGTHGKTVPSTEALEQFNEAASYRSCGVV